MRRSLPPRELGRVAQFHVPARLKRCNGRDAPSCVVPAWNKMAFPSGRVNEMPGKGSLEKVENRLARPVCRLSTMINPVVEF